MRLLSALVVCVSIIAIPGPTVAQDAFVDLFNGENLDGWTQKGGKATYEVKDGMIVGSTVPNTPNSFLCTEKTYGDFELHLEFKVHPELNSGIQIRSNSNPEYKNGRVHGYQVEIDPSIRAWSCGIYDEGRRGWLYDLKKKAEARYAFKQNDWNHYRIVAVGDSIQTWINGIYASELKDDMTAEGFIALQVHGVGGRKDPITVSWRNVRLREVTDGQPAESGQPKMIDEFNQKPVVGKVSDGYTFTEGPAMGPDGKIYFSDIPNEKIHVYDPETKEVAVHRSDSGKANGLVWTPHDALLACEGGARRVSMQTADGKVTTVVDKFEDKKLNSPNDITLDAEGGFYFTDPRYGNRDDMEMEVEGVYYVNRGRQITRVCDDIERPNGIELSQNGKMLFVADTGSGSVFVFDVEGPGKISNKRKFAEIGSDGMTIDQRGCLYLTNGNAVHVYAPPQGEALGKELENERIVFPENPANVTFGGGQESVLYVTARKGFYSAPMGPIEGGRAYANPK